MYFWMKMISLVYIVDVDVDKDTDRDIDSLAEIVVFFFNIILK